MTVSHEHAGFRNQSSAGVVGGSRPLNLEIRYHPIVLSLLIACIL